MRNELFALKLRWNACSIQIHRLTIECNFSQIEWICLKKISWISKGFWAEIMHTKDKRTQKDDLNEHCNDIKFDWVNLPIVCMTYFGSALTVIVIISSFKEPPWRWRTPDLTARYSFGQRFLKWHQSLEASWKRIVSFVFKSIEIVCSETKLRDDRIVFFTMPVEVAGCFAKY